jgi:hypothetical protein
VPVQLRAPLHQRHPEVVDVEERAIRPNGRVEVRARFDGTWAGAFEVADVVTMPDGEVGYLVRRVSDGAALPTAFSEEEVRPA